MLEAWLQGAKDIAGGHPRPCALIDSKFLMVATRSFARVC